MVGLEGGASSATAGFGFAFFLGAMADQKEN